MNFSKEILLGLLLLLFSNILGAQVKVHIKNQEAYHGSIVKIDIVVFSFKNVGALQFSMNWDHHVIDYQYSEGVMKGLGKELIYPIDSQLVYSWFDDSGRGVSIEDSSVILSLFFKVIGDIGTSTPVQIVNEPLDIQAGQVEQNTTKLIDLIQENIEALTVRNPLIYKTEIGHNSCYQGIEGYIYLIIGRLREPYTIRWSGPAINITNSLNQNNLIAGTYKLLITDTSNQITFLDTFFTIEEPMPIQVATFELSSRCEKESLNLTIINGIPPYLYAIDNNQYTTEDQFYNLTNGLHTLRIQDATGCEIDTIINVESGKIWDSYKPYLEVSQNSIKQGEATQITIIHPLEISTVQWLENGQYLQILYPSISVKPLKSSMYVAKITDEDGCNYELQTEIKVEQHRPLFIPTAFSPNGDGINDIFEVYGNELLEKIKKVQIFDRWKNRVYEQKNVPVGQSIVWDGRYKGKTLNSGIYIYLIEVSFKDGKTENIVGDVFLKL